MIQKGVYHPWNERTSHLQSRHARREVKTLKTTKVIEEKNRYHDSFSARFHSKEAKEVMDTLERLTRPIDRTAPNYLSYEDLKKCKIPNKDKDVRPYSWWRDGNKTSKAGTATSATQTLKTNTQVSTIQSQTTTSMSGGGKIKMKKTRVHESHSRGDEETASMPSYDLENIKLPSNLQYVFFSMTA